VSKSARWGGLATARRAPRGLLPAVALGMTLLSVRTPALAQEAQTKAEPQQEVVVTAARDAAITAKVEQAFRDDPNIYTGHVTVETRNGIVTLGGIVTDQGDLMQILALARRIAGKRRIRDDIEFIQPSPDDDW
jgi:osmotically-inducible protein OsmY